MKRRTLVQASAAGVVLAGLGVVGHVADEQWSLGATDGEGWRPMAWPFPRDAWPAGKAWQRDGTEVYVRLKLGFCGNCDTGVVTDEEVDKVTDLDLLDERFTPVGPGSKIRITDLVGRSRIYKYKNWTGDHLAEGIAVNYKCDLLVAVVVGDVTNEKVRKAAHLFLESNTPQVWINAQLEGR